MSVELRHLRSFVAVAEELNFTRAAARVHLAQQALSAQIRQLEELLGTPLFTRTTRKVEMTAAGRALLERAPALLGGVEEAIDAAALAGRGESGELTVEELLDEPVGWIDDMDPVARDFWALGDQRHGRPPRIGARITGFEDLFAAVRAGQIIAASPASVVTVLPFTDVVTRPVRGLAPAGFAVCRRANDPNPIAESFVRTAVALRDADLAGPAPAAR